MIESIEHIDHMCEGGVGAHSQNGCGWDRWHPAHPCDLNKKNDLLELADNIAARINKSRWEEEARRAIAGKEHRS